MKAIGYARVSTDEQAREGVSLAAQESKLRAYAALYDVELVDVVVDAGVSAKTLDRPGLSAALARIDAGEAEGLIIAKLDRLTRSVADWNALIDAYFGKRAALLSVGDQIDTRTAAGRLVLNVLVSVAQWEREAIGERTADALAHKQANGEKVGAPAFGYRIEGTGLAEVADELKAVEVMREMRAAGASLRAIADELNTRGIATKRGGVWAAATVRGILARAV